jgi:hypothetical protein
MNADAMETCLGAARKEQGQLGMVARFLVGCFGIIVFVVVVVLVLLWWGSRVPKRPSNVSSAGIFIERGSVPFKLSTHGDWLDCWQDSRTGTDWCKLTKEDGSVEFEDTFLPYGPTPVPASKLRIDSEKTGSLFLHVSPNDLTNDVSLPIIFLQGGEILLPQSRYQRGREIVEFWVLGRGH